MVAHMNAEALKRTIETGEAWYFSRSRKALWKKGESSGHIQRVVEMRVDCDQDAVWIKVEQNGPGACHTGRRSCFYRAVPLGKAGAVTLEFRDAEQDLRSEGGVRQDHDLSPWPTPQRRRIDVGIQAGRARRRRLCHGRQPRQAQHARPRADASFVAEVEALGRRDDLRALVLTGAGEKAFIGGASIDEMAALDRASAERLHHAACTAPAIACGSCRCR